MGRQADRREVVLWGPQTPAARRCPGLLLSRPEYPYQALPEFPASRALQAYLRCLVLHLYRASLAHHRGSSHRTCRREHPWFPWVRASLRLSYRIDHHSSTQ